MTIAIGAPSGPWGAPETESLIEAHMAQNFEHGVVDLYAFMMRNDQAMLSRFALTAAINPEAFVDLDCDTNNPAETDPQDIAIAAQQMLADSKSGQRAELWFAPTIDHFGGTRVLYLGKIMLGSGLYFPGSLTSLAISHPVSNSGKWMGKATQQQLDILQQQMDDLARAGLKPGFSFAKRVATDTKIV